MYSLLLTALLLSNTAAPIDPPAKLNIDENRVTVSGLSAGAMMAHQLHIAYSDLFSGAALIAGGPFGCADGSLATAMARCMGNTNGALPIAEFEAGILAAAEEGKIDPVENLADDPVWLFHGTLDTTVAAGLSQATGLLYAEFLSDGQIREVFDVAAGHTFPARGRGHACTLMEPPYVADCDYDAAGELLNFLYAGLKAPESETETELLQVALPGAAAAGLSDTAWLFVPGSCTTGEHACALHLVLHGCAQSAISVGTDFIEQSGYLPWAAANDIVLAFPQVVPGPLNPYACWDWWGYTGADYRWKNGQQMMVLTEWIRNL